MKKLLILSITLFSSTILGMKRIFEIPRSAREIENQSPAAAAAGAEVGLVERSEKLDRAIVKAQEALERLSLIETERYEQCITTLREIKEQLDRSGSCDSDTVVNFLIPKINFLMKQIKKSTDQEFKDSVIHLHTILLRMFNVVTISPTRPTRAKATQSTPKRPKTPKAIAIDAQRIFDLGQDPDINRARIRLAAMTPPALGDLHKCTLPGLNVRHIEEGHVISDLQKLIDANTLCCRAVFKSKVNGVICAVNPHVFEKPQKTFFPTHIATEGADDHVVGKIFITIDDASRTERIAKGLFLEILYNKEHQLPFVLVTRERFEEGEFAGIRKNSQTMYPIFSFTQIDGFTPYKIRFVHADILNAQDLHCAPELIIELDLAELISILLDMKRSTIFKNDHFISDDADYICVDIAPYLHMHYHYPIEHGIIVKIKKSELAGLY